MPTLTWLTRDDDTRVASKVPYRLLEEAPDLGHGDRDSGNLLIQGDNLDALKALLPFYAGRVKCIYIDPPYNTKSAFEEYDDNLEHSKWLSMMYSRLDLLWDFLSNDNGTILISINDDEGHYLKVLCDELFGRKNFVASFVWHYEGNTDNQSGIINYHEYILLYSKTGKIDPPGVIDPNVPPESKLFNSEVRNTIVKNGPKNPLVSVRIPAGFPASFECGVISPADVEFPRYSAPLVVKNGKTCNPVEAVTGWQSRKILEAFIGARFEPVLDTKGQKTRFEITRSGAIEGVKERGAEKGHVVSVLRNFGTTNQMRIMLDKVGSKFSFPKPVDMISYLLSVFSKSDGDIVLDSFLGSATTFHAVLDRNKRDGKQRKFIGIEFSNKTAMAVVLPRMKAVIEGNESAELVRHGSGFRFYRLGPPVFDADGHIRHDISFPVLASHVWFSETGAPWNRRDGTPVLGIHQGTAYALLYNGVLGDKRPQGGNVLTTAVLRGIRADIATLDPSFDGPLVIYGESARLGEARLKALGVTFKQTPYDVKAR